MDTIRVCETCGSENVRTAGDGGMGWCEDCDAPCSTVEICEHCNNTGVIDWGPMRGMFCGCDVGKEKKAEG